MGVTTLIDELARALRDNNLGIEEYEHQHQEQKRLVERWAREAENYLKGKKAVVAADVLKRPLSRVLAEESKPVPIRSSRSAAKAAASKIRCNLETENEGSDKKRRCVVKLERISAPVLDIIVEEQDNMSPVVEEQDDMPSDVKENVLKHNVDSATVNDKTFCKTKSKDNNVDSPSSDNQSPFQNGVAANSTFVVGVVPQETLECALSHVGDAAKRNCENSPTGSVQNKSCSGTVLQSTFVISAGNADSLSNQVVEDKHLDVLPRTPEKQTASMKGIKTKQSQAKAPTGKGFKQNEEAYSNLQKLIIESPVRVTRTKTRAFAQAVAAAAANTNGTENVQEPVTKQYLPENASSIKHTKKKLKIANKKEVNGLSNSIMSPPFQKHSNKTTPEDNMKENYILAEKALKESAIRDLNSGHRLKTPLSANNTLCSNSFQTSKMGVGNVLSHCETFITKNKQVNQKLIEESKYIEEKITEAEKKKERMLKEKAELQKRNNEARAAKVAKTREQLERQRAIQQQQQEREKEQRLKIAQQKREEELALKRQLAQQRIAEVEERRKQEEEQYLQSLKKKDQEEAERKALQIMKEAEEQSKANEAEKNKKEIKVKSNVSQKKVAQPNDIFSVNDIYSGEGSDDEEITMKKRYPSWTADNRARRIMLSCQDKCGSLIAEFFQMKPHTPDLIKIFGTVPDRALVRTSSAVWYTPPCDKTY